MPAYAKNLIILLAILLVGIAIGLSASPKPEPIALIEHQTVTETITDEVSRRQLRLAIKENEELHQRIKDLNARPTKVITQYIEVPGQQVVLHEIPDDYLYMNEGGLVVAEHHLTDEGFVAIVHDISIENKLVVSTVEGQELVHAEATVSTSYDDTELAVLTDTKSVGLRDKPKVSFSPLVQIQMMSDLDGTYSAAGGAYAGLEIDAQANVWIGVGVDVSNKQIRPAAKLVLRF